MFTDWTQTDPHYFYLRGAIMGCVLTLMVVMPIINELRKRLRRAANSALQRGRRDESENRRADGTRRA